MQFINKFYIVCYKFERFKYLFFNNQHNLFVMLKEQNIYQKYINTLQNEVASREKERIQFTKCFEQLQTYNTSLLYQLEEYKLNSSILDRNANDHEITISDLSTKLKYFHQQLQKQIKINKQQKQNIRILSMQIQNLKIHIKSSQFNFQKTINEYKQRINAQRQLNKKLQNEKQQFLSRNNQNDLLKIQLIRLNKKISTLQSQLHTKSIQQSQFKSITLNNRKKQEIKLQELKLTHESLIGKLKQQYLIKEQSLKQFYQTDILNKLTKINNLESLILKNKEQFQNEYQKLKQQCSKKINSIKNQHQSKNQQNSAFLQEIFNKQILQKSNIIKSLKEQLINKQNKFNELLTEITRLNCLIQESNMKQLQQLQNMKLSTSKQVTNLKQIIQNLKQKLKSSTQSNKKQVQIIKNKQTTQIRILRKKIQHLTEQNSNLKTSSQISIKYLNDQQNANYQKIKLIQNQNSELVKLLTEKQYQQKRIIQQFNQQLDKHKQSYQKQHQQYYNILQKILSNISVIGTICDIFIIKSQHNLAKFTQKQIFQYVNMYCQKISQYINEKDKNQQLKNKQIQNLKQTISMLRDQFNQQYTSQKTKHYNSNQQLSKKLFIKQKELISIKEETQNLRIEYNQKIKNLKYNILIYQNKQITYQSDLKLISKRVDQNQSNNQNNLNTIDELNDIIIDFKYKNQKMKQNNLQQIQKINKIYFNQILLLNQQEKIREKIKLQELNIIITNLQSQNQQLKQKIIHADKIIQKKQQKNQQLNQYYINQIQIKQLKFAEKLKQFQDKQRNIDQKLINGNLLIQKVNILEQDIQSQQKQTQVLQENNSVLRKKLITSINQQQRLRQQLKQTRKSVSRSRSKHGSRQKSLQLQSKYLCKTPRSSQKLSTPPSPQISFISHNNSNQSNIDKSYDQINISQERLNSLKNQLVGKVNQYRQKGPVVPLDLRKLRQRINYKGNHDQPQTVRKYDIANKVNMQGKQHIQSNDSFKHIKLSAHSIKDKL